MHLSKHWSRREVLGVSVGVSAAVSLLGWMAMMEKDGKPLLTEDQVGELILEFDAEVERLAVARGTPLEQVRNHRRDVYVEAVLFLSRRLTEMGIIQPRVPAVPAPN